MERDEMLRLFEAHRAAEAARDIDGILNTFVPDPFLETMALGLRSKAGMRCEPPMRCHSSARSPISPQPTRGWRSETTPSSSGARSAEPAAETGLEFLPAEERSPSSSPTWCRSVMGGKRGSYRVPTVSLCAWAPRILAWLSFYAGQRSFPGVPKASGPALARGVHGAVTAQPLRWTAERASRSPRPRIR